MSSSETAIPKRIERFNTWKRAFDLVVLTLLSPAILIVGFAVSLIVLCALGRPVIFRQERTGRREQPFKALKFRTMSESRDASGGLLPDRDRLTSTGRVLRALSLDELPQLLNVVLGDMSIVGPRPLLPRYLPYYREDERIRHWVRPGITGLAQVTGRNAVLWDQRLELDRRYVTEASYALDARILYRTVMKVFRREDVSVIAGDSGEPLDVVRSYPERDGYRLRRFEPSDISTRVRWMNDPATRQHMTLPDNVTEESTSEWLGTARADKRRRDFAVYDDKTFEVVAMIGIKAADPPTLPEMYIFVDPNRHGAGIGRLSLELLFAWMEQTSQYVGCRLSVARGNSGAIALYEKFGFRRVAEDSDSRIAMELELAAWRGGRNATG